MWILEPRCFLLVKRQRCAVSAPVRSVWELQHSPHSLGERTPQPFLCFVIKLKLIHSSEVASLSMFNPSLEMKWLRSPSK